MSLIFKIQGGHNSTDCDHILKSNFVGKLEDEVFRLKKLVQSYPKGNMWRCIIQKYTFKTQNQYRDEITFYLTYSNYVNSVAFFVVLHMHIKHYVYSILGSKK